MRFEHRYAVSLEWTGARGAGTSGHRAYGRDHLLRAEGRPEIAGSADRTFFGDADRWNPEELLLAALSQCHLLSYLHSAAAHGVVVLGYEDAAHGLLVREGGGGRFAEATLRPRVLLAPGSDVALAEGLHEEAARACFIAASVNFPVRHEPTTTVAD